MRAFLALALVAAVANAATLSTFSMEHASKAGWQVASVADDAHPLTVRITLPRSNMAYLTNFVEEVSNPDSEMYTKYATTEDILESIRPADASVEAVKSWLVATGQRFTLTATHDFVVETTVGQASRLFATTFRSVFNSVTDQTSVVGDAVTVPDEIAEHVETVFGIHGLPLPPRKVSAPTAGNAVTPAVIESTYGVSGVTPSGSDKNRQAIAEFQGQLLSQDDLTTFFNKYVPKAKSGDDKVYKYVGDNQQGEGVEANLDIQYIMGVAPGIKTEAWQYAGGDFCADLKTWSAAILSTSNGPNVHSVSYGWQGELSQIGCSDTQVSSIDDNFKAAAAAGVTIIFASGDSGSGYTSTFGSDAKLYSSWPASSLYVTAVGATRFINQTPGDGEQATDQFGSGGGFSRVITPAPEWQKDAISTFYTKETKAPAKSMYGYGGRGTPDVAALGENFQVIINGNAEGVGGTSAAAPTFAGIISLVNEARVQAGKAPLGLLNQFLYKNAAAFNDITVGSDRISRQGLPVPDGFDCVEGWDPVTGWGTPKFDKLLKAAMDV